MKHTKGPWKVDAYGVVTGGQGELTSICETYQVRWENSYNKNKLEESNKQIEKAKANGRLIAAAPELLEQLKDLVRYLKSQGDTDLEAAEEVIAKAEGNEK